MFDFDTNIDRRGTHCGKWDSLEALYGVSPDDGIAMWVADMDFQAPPAVRAALRREVEMGVHGYFGDNSEYIAAITGWMETRHGWTVDPKWILTTHGLVSAVGLAIQAFSDPGDGVILFTPVYHAFAKMIKANGRQIVEAVMPEEEGSYRMDLSVLEGTLTGREKMLILCSPHNPNGRVWTLEELGRIVDFCEAHDLILISDEIHHDLVLPGNQHHVLAKNFPQASKRLITLTAASKTFNLAGGMTGNAIIEDAGLRARFSARHQAAGASPNRFGMIMTTAAYGHSADWLDDLIVYLDGNRQILDAGLNAIPGVRSIPLQATYLAWVDFRGTGMSQAEVLERTEGRAKVVGNHGTSFGTGGEGFVRFNIGTQRARVEEAVSRLQAAFADLQ